jgi:FMN phosphatase YigB (HAD superfamily)
MYDIILFGIMGICIFMGAMFVITGTEWCQKLMLKKYFPQTVEILKRYQSVYEMWQLTVQRFEEVEEEIKWYADRLKYFLIVDNREELEKFNELHLERKQLIEHEKKLKELLKQDKFLIEAYTPFILFNEFRPYQIYKRQEFCLFDVIWVYRKQKKIKKTLDKHFSYIEKSGK